MDKIEWDSNFSIYKWGKLVHREQYMNTEQNQKAFLLCFCLDNGIMFDKEIELPILDYLVLKTRENGYTFETY